MELGIGFQFEAQVRRTGDLWPTLPACRGRLVAPVPELALGHAWRGGERQVGHFRAVQAVTVTDVCGLHHIAGRPLRLSRISCNASAARRDRPRAQTRTQTLTSGVGRGIRCPERGTEHVPFATRTTMFVFLPPLSALIVVSSSDCRIPASVCCPGEARPAWLQHAFQM